MSCHKSPSSLWERWSSLRRSLSSWLTPSTDKVNPSRLRSITLRHRNQPHRRPLLARTLRRLFLSLLPLPFLGLPALSQVDPPFVTWEGSEYSMSLTYVGAPHTEYTLENADGFLKTTGTTNECGILTVNLPSSFPAVREPFSGDQWAGVHINNSFFKFFWWQNKVYKGNDIDTSELNCAKVAEIKTWGWNWTTTASKGKVMYWEQGMFQPSTTYPVVAYGDSNGTWQSGRTGIKKAKSNACGIVTFRFLYHGANNLTEKGYILQWNKPFILKAQGASVSTSTSSDWLYSNAKPFCKNGQLYLPETEEEYDDDQE